MESVRIILELYVIIKPGDMVRYVNNAITYNKKTVLWPIMMYDM